jgi:hypothetical protein
MTVSHKDLTGTDLHEIKGASTATLGQVPISDGAGSAPMGKLTHLSLQTTGNPFGGHLLHVQEVQTAGVTSSSGVPAPTGTTQVLNTVKTNEISGASLAANLITLPAGTYHAECTATFCAQSANASNPLANAILNSSVSGVLLQSPTSFTAFSTNVAAVTHQGQLHFGGRFTLAGTANLSLIVYVATALGQVSVGTSVQPTVFSDIKIWKVA